MSEAAGDSWYADAWTELEQGDVLLDFGLIAPIVSDAGALAFEQARTNVIVLTQSCDLWKKAQKYVLVAPVSDYGQLSVRPELSHLRQTRYRESLARGTSTSDFLLPPSPDGRLTWSLVSFREIHTMPKAYVRQAASASSAIALTSPYREHLSQAVARFFMRVGLPTGLESFMGFALPT